MNLSKNSSLPVLNAVVLQFTGATMGGQGEGGSRRTGGGLIMCKMRAWKGECIREGRGADEGCPPCTHRSWPYWEQEPGAPPVCRAKQNPFPPPNSIVSTGYPDHGHRYHDIDI